MQVSNGPINSNSSISSHTAQSSLVKSIPAKVPSTSTCTSPGKQTQQISVQSPTQPQNTASPPANHQQQSQPQSQQQQPQQQPQQTTKSSPPSITNYTTPPLVTLANGFTPSSIPITSTISATSISNQSSITNGTALNSLGPVTAPTASLPVGLPHPATATAPTAIAPSIHPSLDSSTSIAGRTNSPAVATSAVLSAAAPAANGNSSATTVSSNGSIGSYRSGYPGYPLYAPYSSFHHTNPYMPSSIPSPSASPRTVDSRSRESPLVNSKGIRPMTPTTINNGASHLASGQSQPSMSLPISQGHVPTSSSHLREQSTHSALSLQKAHSPRGHSPSRERDSYRYDCIEIFIAPFFPHRLLIKSFHT